MSDTLFPAGTLVDVPGADLEALGPNALGWDIEFIKLGSEDLRVTLHAFHTPHLQLGTSYYSDAYMLQGKIPEKTVLLTLLESEGILNFQHNKLKNGELIFARHEDAFDLLTSAPSKNYSIVIEEGLFSSFFELYFEVSYHSVIESSKFFVQEAEREAFIETIKGWLNFTTNAQELDFTMHEYMQLERQILTSIFSFLALKSHKYHESNVERARLLLHKNLQNTYYISDLVEELNVNERSLQNSFKNHLGISAKHYLKQLRLHAIRQELLNLKETDQTIKEIAMKYNFFHMGHFTEDYKKLFFETPGETLSNT